MDGVVDGFYVAFLYRIKIGVLFLLHTSAHKCSNDLFVLFLLLLLLMLVSLRLASCLHIQNVNPEPTHFLSLPSPSPPFYFILFSFGSAPLIPLSATRFPKEQTHTKKRVSLEYVTNSVCVCVCILKRSLEEKKKTKKQKESTRTTTNGELFSSTFDLIIYFCVVGNFGFVQIWIFLGGGGGCEVTLDHIIAAFSV